MNEAFKILAMHVDTGGVWRYSLYFGLFLIMIYFGERFKYRMGVLVKLAWTYFAFSSLLQFEAPINRYGDLTGAFIQTGGQNFCEFFVITVFMLLLQLRGRRNLWIALYLIMILENVLVWVKGYGLMNQTSFDCALLAAFLPLSQWPLFVFSLVTIAFHHGSTALLIIFSQILAFTFIRRKEWWPPFAAVLAAPVLFLIARFHNSDITLNGVERLKTYQHFMTDWWNSGWGIRLFGTGSGSFIWISIIDSNFKPPLFLQMHSDWLQILYENGIFGFVLVLSLFILAIKKSLEKGAPTHQIYSVVGLGAFALTYHPLRFLPSMILCALVFTNTFKRMTWNVTV